MQRWMGQGNAVKTSYNTSDRLAGVLDITRPILSTMGALGVAAGAALAYGGIPVWSKCLVGVIAALLAFAGIHAFNDFVDQRRDVVCWPGRPIPSKRLKAPQALLIALGSYAIALVIVWFAFNPTCFAVSAVAIGLGCLYSGYLRDRVGYLVLPPIEGTLWLCGWAAFSPNTLFTSWAPWILWGFSALWQAGHIMIYSPLHPIQHVKGEKLTQLSLVFDEQDGLPCGTHAQPPRPVVTRDRVPFPKRFRIFRSTGPMPPLDFTLLVAFGTIAILFLALAVFCFLRALKVAGERDGDLKMFFWAVGGMTGLIISGMSAAYILLPILFHPR